MDDPKLTELRRLVGQHEKLVYEAVKAGMVFELPHESQLYAQAMQEHMHLKHVHNALEFADLREGAQYEISATQEPQSVKKIERHQNPHQGICEPSECRKQGKAPIYWLENHVKRCA